MNDTPKSESQDQSPETDSNAGKNSALYDRFAEKTHEIYDKGQEKTREALEKAMELSRQQLTSAGEFTSEQGEKFKHYLRRDFEQTLEDMRQLGGEAKEHLNPARLGAGALSSLAKLLHAAGGAMTALSNKAEDALVYQTGEITMAGTLTCSECGHKVQLKATSVVPACPACQGTRFRKSY